MYRMTILDDMLLLGFANIEKQPKIDFICCSRRSMGATWEEEPDGGEEGAGRGEWHICLEGGGGGGETER